MNTLSSRHLVSTGNRILFPSVALLVVGGAFLLDVREVNELHAGIGSKLGPDSDGDGLADTQEFLLGTNPDLRDTDGDGYHDIEEVARRSDPNLATSVPSSTPLSVALYSYVEFGFLNMHTAVYVDDGDTSGLDFEFGVVINGTAIPGEGSIRCCRRFWL